MSAFPFSDIKVPAGIPALLRDLVHERTGLYFEDDRLDTMLDKLRDRAGACECGSYLDYYYILKYDEQGPAEWLRVMDAFSVQETYFYREYAQIKAVVDFVVPAWFRQSSQPLSIWSAACATGEEPYSLAMALREGGWGEHPITIQASDASETALARARAAVYRERSFRSFPAGLREKYFDPVPEGWKFRTDRFSPILFRRANLAAANDLADLATSPVVFCRNVFIYFSPQAIERTVYNIALHMPDGAKLFIGASESLLKLKTQFELQSLGDAFVYVRRPRRGAATA